ncbi:MAG: hypothetical protein U0872_11930 [Planctomycetaceae bacterium]
MLCAPAWCDDAVLTDRHVPAQYRREKTETAVDNFPYQGLTVVKSGSSAGATKRQAIAELPLDRLPMEQRQKVQAVVDGLGLYRRLPSISFEVDRDVYAFFLQNPDVAVSSWRAMGISKFTISEIGPHVYQADAGDGSQGSVEVFYATPEDTLIFCRGAFKSPLVSKPIVANSVMRVQAKFERLPDGRIQATHHGDVYVEFPSQTVETVAKLISPVSHVIADRNFKQLTFFAHMMTVAMARQPGWIEALAERMDDLDDRQRTEFLKLSAATYVAARQREAATLGQTLSVEELLRPLRQVSATDAERPAGVKLATPAAGAPSLK